MFAKEVEDFYKMSAYHKEHGNLDERIFGKENVDKFKHVTSALMTVTTDLEKDEIDDIIASAGGEKEFKRNFAPYKLTGITENMVFEKTILQRMSCEDVASELDIFPIEVEQVRDGIVEKVKTFIRERNGASTTRNIRMQQSKTTQAQMAKFNDRDKGDKK